jgi:hypothetical protein
MRIYAKVRLWEKADQAAQHLRKHDPNNERGDAAETSWILLQAATRPAASKAASSAAKAQALIADIRRFDPKNEKGILQNAILLEFQQTWQSVTQAESLSAAWATLDKAEKQLTELAAFVTSGEIMQRAWADLGLMNARADRPEKAIAILETAVAAAPDSAIAGRIKNLLDRIRKTQKAEKK